MSIQRFTCSGPIKIGKFRETLAEGALHLGPEQDRVFADLTPEENERAILDIIRICDFSHITDAKDIWDNVKMLLEGSELKKDEHELQLYDDFKHFRQNKCEIIHEYYVRFRKLINDIRNIKMTMPKMQLNSKFVNNMLREWGRFMSGVKLNRGLKTSNYDQLYAYLKKNEAHFNKNKMMLEKYNQHVIDPIAFMSNVSPQHYPSQSSATPQSRYVPPGRQNRGQGYNARGAVAAGNKGVQNRGGNANPGQAKPIKVLQGQDVADASSGDWSVLDEDQLLFILGGQANTFDDDVDKAPVLDLALNDDNVFQVDQCDAFESDVDEASTAHTLFMENLSLADPIYDEAGPSYDSDILSEVQVHDNYLDNVGEYHEHVKDNATQSALYNGHEIVKTNHAPAVVHDSEDTLKIAEITRKKMLEKMKGPLCVEKKVKIAPPDYSKENYLATFAPQRHLTPEQIFWSLDIQSLTPKPISKMMVYLPNTPERLVPRVLPTKSQVKNNLYTLTQLFSEFDKNLC
ncbi:hypothetical protein Tco_1228683 [Tanacetum coccineum]